MSYFGQFNERFTIVDVNGVLISTLVFRDITSSLGSIPVGSILTGATSGATGEVVEYERNDYVKIRRITGTFENETVNSGSLYFTINDIDDFTLESDYIDLDEPEAFADQKFSLVRSLKYRGFNSEYSDGELTVLFDKILAAGETYSPFSFILNVQETGGFDCLLMLRAYRTPTGGSEEYKEWKINLDSAKQLDYAFSCRLKRVRLNDKLRTRLDTDIDVESSENLDGVSDTALTLKTIPLHSRAILLEYEGDYVFSIYTEDVVSIDTGFFQPKGGGSGGFMDVAPTVQIKSSLSVVGFGRNEWHSEADLGVFHEAEYDGVYNIEARFTTQNGFLGVTSGWGNPDNCVLRYTDATGENVTDVTFTKSTSTDPTFGTGYAEYELDTQIILSKGSQVFIFFTSATDKSFYQTPIGEASGNIIRDDYVIINADTYSEPSTTEGDFIYPLLNKLIQKAIGNQTYNPLVSTILQRTEDGAVSDGVASMNFITTGQKIRLLEKSLICSIRDILDFIRVRYNAGFAIVDYSGNEKVVVERASHFFQDVEILSITTYEELIIDNNDDLIFNEVEVGYSKYAKTNESGGSDSFNTTRGYLLPIESVKEKESIVCDVITDDVEIERIKRLKRQNKESDQSDEAVFIIHTKRFNSSNRVIHISGITETANEIRQSVEMDGAYELILNGYYLEGQLDSATEINVGINSVLLSLNEDTYTIYQVEYDKKNNRTIITTNEVLSYTGTFNLYYAFDFDVDIFLPQRIEGFSAITGITDPPSVYNLTHTPSGILFEWWDYFGGVINEKDGSLKIKFTSRVNNTDLQKTGGDLTGATAISESQDHTLTAVRAFNPTYLNRKKYRMICSLEYDSELIVLLRALSGEHGSKDWGYVSSVDNEGTAFKMYPTEVIYEPKNKQTEITGWGKKS